MLLEHLYYGFLLFLVLIGVMKPRALELILIIMGLAVIVLFILAFMMWPKTIKAVIEELNNRKDKEGEDDDDGSKDNPNG